MDGGCHGRAAGVGASRMALSVGEDQGASPRTTVEHPLVDAEMLTQHFHIGQQMISRVARHVDIGVGGVRSALAATALSTPQSHVGE